MERLQDYTEDVKLSDPNELHIHTWMDATLREIANALKTAVKCANDKDARLNFYHIFQDSKGIPLPPLRISKKNL